MLHSQIVAYGGWGATRSCRLYSTEGLCGLSTIKTQPPTRLNAVTSPNNHGVFKQRRV